MPTIKDNRPAYLPKQASYEGYVQNEFYKSPAWRKLRVMHLRQYPLCAACEAIGLLTDCTKYRKGAIDHVISIRLGGAMLDASNLMTLCASCHAKKSRLEGHGLTLASVGEDGHRLPAHGVKQQAIEAINNNKLC